MLIAEGISFSYGERTVLKDISLTVARGERVVLTGHNGSGKSSLALTLAGVAKADAGEAIVSVMGRVDSDGLIGLVPQEPENFLLATSVERELAYAMENAGVPVDEMRRRVRETAAALGIDDLLDAVPSELSGGMQARVAIASVMVLYPHYLVLDEPDAFLDVEGRHRLLDTLNKLAENGTGILLITQDIRLAEWGDRAMTLKDGSIIDGISDSSPIEPVHLPIPDKDVIVSTDSVSFGYTDKPILSGIDITIHKGESVALVGASGAGKSTLALVLAGLIKPDEGDIKLDARAGVVFQFPEMQLFAETVLDDVMFGPRNFSLEDPEKNAETALSNIELPETLWERSPYHLSEGEKRRAGIAGVLACKPNFLILDEAASFLDPFGRRILVDIIGGFLADGGSVLVISHELEMLKLFAQRVIVLHNGAVAYDGSMANLLRMGNSLQNWGIE